MTLDQYQLCPCGSGKKIKFCCAREFVHDLDRIQRMVQGDQRLAALEKTDALLAKYPDRPSLLMTKAEIEMQLDEPAKAKDTVDRLQQVDPKNPSGFAMRSLLAIVMEGNLNAAINFMQDAFEAVDGVGHAAHVRGHLGLGQHAAARRFAGGQQGTSAVGAGPERREGRTFGPVADAAESLAADPAGVARAPQPASLSGRRHVEDRIRQRDARNLSRALAKRCGHLVGDVGANSGRAGHSVQSSRRADLAGRQC